MIYSIKSWKFLCIVLPFLATTFGCGGGAKVTGKVTFEDGTPLTVGTVSFQTESEQMIGHIKSDGTYELSPNDRTIRIPKGDYKVCIVNAYIEVGEPLKGANEREDFGGRRMAQSVINTKYESTSTSDLTCKVDGTTVYNITVTKP
ncbi:MAG: hypothetical protein FWD31_02210 [Planctomycetaceae bacterium]|nr:hypothetical protein [Planctomycetaceae bacterium]